MRGIAFLAYRVGSGYTPRRESLSLSLILVLISLGCENDLLNSRYIDAVSVATLRYVCR